MSQQGLRQASVRAVSGTTLTYEGDFHAMWDLQTIAAGNFNERMLAYCNLKLGTTYTNVNDAMQALAADQGATNFGSMGTFTASLSSPGLIDGLSTAPARAYSTRKLKQAYAGSAIRIRRDNDNAEQDIGFSGQDLNTAAITTFVGSNSAYIAKWYDQSGNADDMVQATAAQQFRIVNAGTLDVRNTKPMPLASVASTDVHKMAGTAAHTVKEMAAILAVNEAAYSNYVGMSGGLPDYNPDLFVGQSGSVIFYNGGLFGSNIAINNVVTLTTPTSGAVFQARGNSAAGASLTLKVGERAGAYWAGWMGEIITWSSELSAGDRTTLYNNQKAYWGTA